MYQYDHQDQAFVQARVEQFREQTERYLAGELTEDEFKPLRLQNGLYVQRHAPMLRIAIPYGVLSSHQMRALAQISETYDEGYGHFSTRQNLQLNGPKLERVPDILAELADVQMHAIQTSGNCIRNVTTDQFAGVAADETADPRPYAELIRQWSSLHPEFAFLPRKFKIALTGASEDRAAVKVHDIGIALVPGDDGQMRFDIYAGGGLGRTPIIGSLIKPGLPQAQLLNYLEAVLRVYNRHGRRDNLYKARIKILVRALGAKEFSRQVESEFDAMLADAAAGTPTGPGEVDQASFDALIAQFADPDYVALTPEEVLGMEANLATQGAATPAFWRWLSRSRHPHKRAGYCAVTISLKNGKLPPGDATATQMRLMAEAADRFGFGELRITHHQNVVLPNVRLDQLHELFKMLQSGGLASANIGLLTDIIACPGGDFCQLANAKSIPIAMALQEIFEDLDELFNIGELELNISGCMNSCGHHHIGHIGILGVDKKGDSFYQISIGGMQGMDAAIGKIIGPSFSEEDVPDAVERLIRFYLLVRHDADERFVDTVNRMGVEPFKEAVYEHAD
ncbi:MAG: nitrite/sulfite reductase [Burkholderiaceae bacterium]